MDAIIIRRFISPGWRAEISIAGRRPLRGLLATCLRRPTSFHRAERFADEGFSAYLSYYDEAPRLTGMMLP